MKIHNSLSFLLAAMVAATCEYSQAQEIGLRGRHGVAAAATSRDLQNGDFCWKDSFGRGVGMIPGDCPSGKERIGALCYTKCPRGYKRFGFDCHQTCPSGFRDDGLFCRRAEYGRGAGYPWKFGDALNDNGMRGRCERDHGSGGCEKWGAVFYPKCRSGYNPFGCCICRPKTPNCGALGMNGGFDLSCAKKLVIGDPTPMVCGRGLENDAGLCYNSCNNAGYTGVGPVCWSKTPAGWVDCGFGAASSSGNCAKVVSDQLLSVGEVAFNVATLGGGKIATGSSKFAKLLADFEKLKDKVRTVMKNNPKFTNALKQADEVRTTTEDTLTLYEIFSNDEPLTEPEDIARTSAELAALFDPTGVSSVVAAYSYPKCSA